MKKKIAVILIVLMIFSFTACSQKSEADEFNVGALKGPTALGMLELLEVQDEPLDGTTKINYTVAAAPDEITAKLLSGELDAACVPINLAPVLYNKTEGQFQIASINTLGMLYIVENGNSVKVLDDLKGKTIYASGKGSTPEYVLNYILTANGIDIEKDVDIQWLGEHAAVAAKVASEEGTLALLPEPFVTTTSMQAEGLNVAIDLNNVWEESTGTSLMMTAFVVNKEFAEQNPGTVTLFLKEYKDSIDSVVADPVAAGVLAEKHGIIAKAKVAEIAIPKCNIVYYDALDKKDDLIKLYEVFEGYNPASIGGKMPDEDFWLK